MTFPLTFEVYKPKQRLLKEDTYQSKPQIAAHMIRELQMMGFKFKLVLADSLYGESDSNFVSVLCELQLDFVVAIQIIMVYGYHKVRESQIPMATV